MHIEIYAILGVALCVVRLLQLPQNKLFKRKNESEISVCNVIVL